MPSAVHCKVDKFRTTGSNSAVTEIKSRLVFTSSSIPVTTEAVNSNYEIDMGLCCALGETGDDFRDTSVSSVREVFDGVQ